MIWKKPGNSGAMDNGPCPKLWKGPRPVWGAWSSNTVSSNIDHTLQVITSQSHTVRMKLPFSGWGMCWTSIFFYLYILAAGPRVNDMPRPKNLWMITCSRDCNWPRARNNLEPGTVLESTEQGLNNLCQSNTTATVYKYNYSLSNIFSVPRDWSKRNTWLSIPQL